MAEEIYYYTMKKKIKNNFTETVMEVCMSD